MEAAGYHYTIMLNSLLILIFVRPFISSLAFPYADSIYSLFLLIFLLCWILSKGFPLRKIKSLKYPLLIFICALLLSTFFSYNKTAGLKELQRYAAYLLIFLAGASFADREKTKVIRAIILAGFIIGLLAIYQYFFGFRHLLDYIYKQRIPDQFALDYISRRRVFFPFVTPNALAGYLIMIIPLTFIYKYGIWLLIPLALGLFLTQSLGAFLSLFLGIMLCFYLQVKFRKRNLLILSGLLVMAGIIFIIRLQAPKQHTQPLFSAVTRMTYWRETIALVKSHPLTGIGPGNFDLPRSRYAHNSYLQLWAETGIFGLLAFIWLTFSIVKSNLKSLKGGPSKTQTALLLTSCIAFLIHNLTDFTFFLPEASFIYWALSGLLFSFH